MVTSSHEAKLNLAWSVHWLDFQDLQVYQTYSGCMADCLKDVITCPYICGCLVLAGRSMKPLPVAADQVRSGGFAAMDVLMSKLSFEHLGEEFLNAISVARIASCIST